MPKLQYKRRIPHIDMTPFVDLGFVLLISFMLLKTLKNDFLRETTVPSEPLRCYEGDYKSLPFIYNLSLLTDSTICLEYIDNENISKSNSQYLRYNSTDFKALLQGLKAYKSYKFIFIKSSKKISYGFFIQIINDLEVSKVSFVIPHGSYSVHAE